MKRIFIIAFTLSLSALYGQTEPEIKIFHRLVILDADDQLMVVKVANADVWVTPGFYQTQDVTIQSGLNDLGASYGIEIGPPKLRGVFLLKREINEAYATSLRNVYSARIKSGAVRKPTGIEEIRWVSIEEAAELITFPHITAMVKGILDHPNGVLGGTLRQFKENDRWETEIIEDFYSF